MKTQEITLAEPIERGDKKISKITLQEPSAQALTGLEVMSVIRGDVQQLIMLLPRICPDLEEHEAKKLSFKNIARISMAVTSFLGD